jgi:hypothetical protein
MKRSLHSFLLGAVLAAPALAQTADDVGLTLDGGMLTVIFGQDCGPVGCAPLFGGNVGIQQSRVLTHYGQAQSLYFIVLGLPGSCLQVPGIDNALLLTDPVIILGAGLTSSPPFVPLPCPNQGIAQETIFLPPGLPPGLVFRAQSLGLSTSTGNLAFSPAIECTVV